MERRTFRSYIRSEGSFNVMKEIDMKEQIEMLVELQKLDSEIFDRKKVLDEVPIRIKELEDELEAKSASLKGQEEGLKKLKISQKQKEMDLETKEQGIKKHQGQLHQIKTNKEYSALEKEIASLKADNSLLEEEIIKLLDQTDEMQKAVSGEREALEVEKKKAAEEKKKIEAEKNKSQAELNDLNAKRLEFVKNVDPGILPKYERILRSKMGVAVVSIAGDACGGCNMSLPPQVINEVKLRAAFVFCENCARILHAE